MTSADLSAIFQRIIFHWILLLSVKGDLEKFPEKFQISNLTLNIQNKERVVNEMHSKQSVASAFKQSEFLPFRTKNGSTAREFHKPNPQKVAIIINKSTRKILLNTAALPMILLICFVKFPYLSSYSYNSRAKSRLDVVHCIRIS